MKSQIDQIKSQAKILALDGKKAEAIVKLRESKEKQQDLDNYLKENPDINLE